ncbi:MAG: hypothetical protein LC737_08785 [Chloroflexi bacterium]|nr:hypothetical protein [Chloroflexota bacterium]
MNTAMGTTSIAQAAHLVHQLRAVLNLSAARLTPHAQMLILAGPSYVATRLVLDTFWTSLAKVSTWLPGNLL